MGVIWHALCFYFTVLGHPGTILGRSWDITEYKKGHCEVQAWIKPDSRDPEAETGSLETEKRVHRIHGTLETGVHIILRSLVAPSRGAGGFHASST